MISCYGNAKSNNLYQIGSMTKAFTGLGIMKLIHEGKIISEHNVSDYLPGFEMYYESSMKKILRDTCILASLMIVMVFGVSIIWSGMTGEIMFGFIVGWFYRSNFWMAFIYVAIVFIVAYSLDMFVTQKDVAFINEKIKERDKG